MSEPQVPNEHVIDDTPVDKPAQEDTYFVDKNGKPFTGEVGTGEEPAAEAAPEVAKPAEKAKEKQKSRGDEWREIREEKKALKRDREEMQAELEAIRQERAELQAERELAQKDPRTFIRKGGHDLRSLLEADLKENDATPEEKERKQAAAAQAELKSELDNIKAELAAARTEKLMNEEVVLLEQRAESVAEDFPRVAARIKVLGPDMWRDFYAAKEQGKNPTVDKLFQSWEAYLERLGVQPPQPAASPKPGAVNRASAKRKGAVQSARNAEEEPDDDADGGVSETGPATLTNRMASERRSNGRVGWDRAGKDAHLSNAISLLRDSD